MKRAVWAAALASSLALAAPAQGEDMTLPVDCILGETCFIQQYVDRDPGPGAADFTCGPLTYNNHNGTDFRLPSRAAMEVGVDVLSATTGRVLGIRDGMADIRLGTPGAPDVTGRECGNGVLVQREDGWRFQYCHLKQGSVSVKKGDTVTQGQVLGQIGMSGRAQFPHLHISVRDSNGQIYDPFDTRQQDEACSFRDSRTFWRDLEPLDYQPGGALASGFATDVPDYDDVRAGTAHQVTIPRTAPALVYWVHYFGVRKDDEIRMQLLGPDQAVLAENAMRMTRNRATQYRAVGRKLRKGLSPGTYTGVSVLWRDNAALEETRREITIR